MDWWPSIWLMDQQTASALIKVHQYIDSLDGSTILICNCYIKHSKIVKNICMLTNFITLIDKLMDWRGSMGGDVLTVYTFIHFVIGKSIRFGTSTYLKLDPPKSISGSTLYFRFRSSTRMNNTKTFFLLQLKSYETEKHRIHKRWNRTDAMHQQKPISFRSNVPKNLNSRCPFEYPRLYKTNFTFKSTTTTNIINIYII